jgi:signal transduction histidine kinase
LTHDGLVSAAVVTGAHAGPQRLRQLVDAVVAVGADLDLRSVLQRIIETATDLVDARYGALGVLDERGTSLSEFITVGVTDQQRSEIGPLPKGLGILGHLIHDASPLRLADIAEHDGSVGFPPNHPPMRSFLGVPVLVRGEVFGNLYLTEKQSGEVFTDVDEELVTGLATAAGVAIENARLYQRARQRERTIDAFGEVATALLAGTGGTEVLQLIATRARELVGGDLATIALPEPGGTLHTAVADGDGAETVLGQRFTREGSISGDVLATGEPVVVEDASADPRSAQPLVRLGSAGPALWVSLVAGEPFGTLSVARRLGAAPFGQADVELLMSFASQASVVLEHESTREQLGRLSRLEDQERIARDLHDSVIQRIFAASLSLQGAAGLSHDEKVRERIGRAIDELDTATRLIRAVIFDIAERSPFGDDSLRRRVLDLASESSRVLGFAPQVLFDGPVDTVIGDEISAELLPTLREALSNVARHAAARTVEVEVSVDSSQVRLRVRDDGAGVRPGEGGGHGLANMRTRAARLGGECDVAPAPGGGTVVLWQVPRHAA